MCTEADPGYRCPTCGTTDESLRYSDSHNRCADCSRFRILKNNAKRKRSNVRTPKLNIDREAFVRWIRSQDRECAYCGLPENAVPLIGALTQVGHPLKWLGVDRVDNAADYAVGNLVLCCFPCNKAKSNTFTYEEMKVIGPAIRRVWDARLKVALGDNA